LLYNISVINGVTSPPPIRKKGKKGEKRGMRGIKKINKRKFPHTPLFLSGGCIYVIIQYHAVAG